MAANFDRLARLYRWLEYGLFGNALWRRRVAFLDDLAGAPRVLMLGEGDGRFLAAFLRRYPTALVDYLDASPEMGRLAKRRAQAAGGAVRVRFFCGDAAAGRYLTGPYDLIVTHFFLDCFTLDEVRALLVRAGAHASPRARWLLSEFQAPSREAALFIRGLYLFFRWTTGLQPTHLPAHALAFRECGYELLKTESAWRGLLVSELWQLPQ